MPDVELIAIQDFSYATRRLRAGDRFTVAAPMAKVLVGIKKAQAPREPGHVPAPPKSVVEQAKESTPQPEKVEAKPVPASSTKTMAKPTAKKTVRKRPAARK